MKSLKRKLVITSAATCALVVLFFLGTSQSALEYELQFAEHRNWETCFYLLTRIAELRYSNVPKFQRLIALEYYCRANKDLDKSWEMLNRVIDSDAGGDLKITPLLSRAKIEADHGRLKEALQDLEQAKVYQLENEAKGVFIMDQSTSAIQKWIDHIHGQLQESPAQTTNSQ